MNLIYLDARLKPSIQLPTGFSYPAEFANYLLFEEAERCAAPDLNTLHWCWPFALHHEQEVTERVFAATRISEAAVEDLQLVAFARDAGDGVWFFGFDGIYFVDLGWESWIATKEEYETFESFVNYWRTGSGLENWKPR